ncbi:hypothetical protein [Actinotalea sp.]|uniref:hypothetical protein n=1 Tax=Actinotalea sp. TaxID=1872145 RepID=UPI003567960F
MNDYDDVPTLAETMTVLDEAIGLLDDVVVSLYAWRDAQDDAELRETLAVAGDLLAQSWASSRRGRQVLTDDVPAPLRTMRPATTTTDLAAQQDAALDPPRFRATRWRDTDGTVPEGAPWIVAHGGVLYSVHHDRDQALTAAHTLATQAGPR